MTRSRLSLITGILAVGAILPAGARAQVDTTSVALRIFQYESEKKSAPLAVALNLIPPLGHSYAGDVKRGLIPAALTWGGIVTNVHVAGDCLEVDPYYGNCLRWENEDDVVYIASEAAFIIGFIWGLLDAYSTATDYNRRLREQLLTVRPVDGGVQIRGQWALASRTNTSFGRFSSRVAPPSP